MLELGAPIIKDIIELVSFFDPEVNLKPNPYEQGCIFFPKIEFFINHYLEALSFLWSEMAISGQIWSFLSKKSEFFL